MNILNKLLQGIFVGVSLVLPGMSGGTAFIILGMYRKLVEDISSLKIKPYFLLGVGALAGVLLGSSLVTSILKSYPDLLVSLLLGMLLASVSLVLKPLSLKNFRIVHAVPVFLGFLLAWKVVDEPITQVPLSPTESWPLIFIAGGLVSATMLLPGVSGSSLLIMMNLYDDMLFFVNHLVWSKLLVFSLGLLTGVLVFSRIISSLYRHLQYPVSFFLVGLLLGSTRALFPAYWGIELIAMALLGAGIVFLISQKSPVVFR